MITLFLHETFNSNIYSYFIFQFIVLFIFLMMINYISDVAASKWTTNHKRKPFSFLLAIGVLFFGIVSFVLNFSNLIQFEFQLNNDFFLIASVLVALHVVYFLYTKRDIYSHAPQKIYKFFISGVLCGLMGIAINLITTSTY